MKLFFKVTIILVIHFSSITYGTKIESKLKNENKYMKGNNYDFQKRFNVRTLGTGGNANTKMDLNQFPYGYSQNVINQLNNPFLSNQQQIENNSLLSTMVGNEFLSKPIIASNRVVPKLLKENVGYVNITPKVQKVYNPVPVMTHYNMPVLHHIPINQVVKKYVPVYYPIPVEHKINIPVKVPIKIPQRVLIPQAVPYGVKVPIPVPIKVEVPKYKEITINKTLYVKIPIYEHIPIYHHFAVKSKSPTENVTKTNDVLSPVQLKAFNLRKEPHEEDCEELNNEFNKYLTNNPNKI